MEIETIIQEKKKIYSSLMKFIEATEKDDFEFLFEKFKKRCNFKNGEEIKLMLQLILKIAENHHRLQYFFNKISQIIQYLLQEIRNHITDYEIYKLFRTNKRILLLFLEQKFIRLDDTIISDILKTEDQNHFPYSHYLYPAIKSFINKNEARAIENEIKEEYHLDLSIFEENCRIGENDSCICTLIRQDLAKEFISFTNQGNISLSSKIQPSIFETNLFLMQKTPTLIEYASFFGSKEIIQYIHRSDITLTTSMWLFTVHSDDAELIHFLEENEVVPDDAEQIYNSRFKCQKKKQPVTYGEIYEESIKCHHNAIADYLKENHLDEIQIDSHDSIIFDCYNYHFFPSNSEQIISTSFKSSQSIISRLLHCCSSLREITIPSSVTEIGDLAFSKSSSLKQVTIPSSVTSIGNSSFIKCSLLTEIMIPSSVISIGDSVFSECLSLTKITFSSSVASIGNNAFGGCSSLIEITIPFSLTKIGDSAFNGCLSLTKITILSPITSIGYSVFCGCLSLKEITIPSSVTSIESYAFNRCSSLTQITFPSSLTSIESYAFNRCSSLTQITFPSSLTSIGDYAFNECSSLTEISIPSSVAQIGEYAFNECTSLAKASISSSNTKVSETSFYKCTSLLPDSKKT